MTADEWLHLADEASVRPGSHILDVGSGSGGPTVYLAEQRGCHVTGVDINEQGVANAKRLAKTRGVADRTDFQLVDARRPLPFPDASFDAILSNDAIVHIDGRLAVLREWHRVLKPGGRAAFTDALVLTGAITHEEVAARSSIGFYLFVPPGENERLLAEAGFTVIRVEDLTAAAAVLAGRWRDARFQHRDALIKEEGESNFQGLQRFLDCVHRVSVERRLSRFLYVAERSR
jgi:cyclopropane fatty-acyl-phospholipid synthase-like methyltransferase